jgi:hypothetical protein
MQLLQINFHEIKWREFITPSFWFQMNYLEMHQSDRLFGVAGLALIVLAIIAYIYARFVNNVFLTKVAKRIAKIFLTIGIFEVIWLGLRYEYVQALGTHIVALLILIVGLIWLYYPIKYLITHYKIDMAEAQRAASREKYLKPNK